MAKKYWMLRATKGLDFESRLFETFEECMNYAFTIENKYDLIEISQFVMEENLEKGE